MRRFAPRTARKLFNSSLSLTAYPSYQVPFRERRVPFKKSATNFYCARAYPLAPWLWQDYKTNLPDSQPSGLLLSYQRLNRKLLMQENKSENQSEDNAQLIDWNNLARLAHLKRLVITKPARPCRKPGKNTSGQGTLRLKP